MKVLLKNTSTSRFMKSDRQWTDAEREAQDFKTPLEAMNYCHLHHLSDAAIVVENEGNTYEMPLRWED